MTERRGLAMDRAALRRHVREALAEDHAREDLTSRVSLAGSGQGRAVLRAGAAGVLAGVEAARETFAVLSPRLRARALLRDGARVRPGVAVLEVRGPRRLVLAGERTALNYLMRLSGVATAVAGCVRALRGTRVTLLDTRKTTPHFRLLEKAAVRAGGGSNHRMGLHDAVLLKENHVQAAGGVEAAVRRARSGLLRLGRPEVPVEVEVQSLGELREALPLPVDRIMLDNFSAAALRRASALLRTIPRAKCPEIEVSGGVTLATLRAHAVPGVDFISMGAITHSAPALAFSLDWRDD